MSVGVEHMNMLLNVICYWIPPPVNHVKSWLKQSSVTAGASVQGSDYSLYVMSAWYWVGRGWGP